MSWLWFRPPQTPRGWLKAMWFLLIGSAVDVVLGVLAGMPGLAWTAGIAGAVGVPLAALGAWNERVIQRLKAECRESGGPE